MVLTVWFTFLCSLWASCDPSPKEPRPLADVGITRAAFNRVGPARMELRMTPGRAPRGTRTDTPEEHAVNIDICVAIILTNKKQAELTSQQQLGRGSDRSRWILIGTY